LAIGMGELEQLLALFLAAALLAAGARRVGAPYPVFLAVGGALLAFVPGAPPFSVPPELALALLDRVEHVPSAIILQLVTTFGVWILAEHIGLSAILTMVSYAITVARRAPELVPAAHREIGDDAFHEIEEELDWLETADGRKED
jgi:monovalent cation/hydrogen antiporter